jgi:hypothetical protein
MTKPQSIEPICFHCRYFRQHQPLTFLTPGECRWEPSNRMRMPEWARIWLENNDKFYGPNREIWSRGNIVTECPAFADVRAPLAGKLLAEEG